MTDVCLVSVPFFNIQRPSVGLGLLKAGLVHSGITSKVIYTNLRFAEAIGIDTYWFISTYSQTDLLGEWIFSPNAFPGYRANQQEYFKLAEKIIRSICSKKNLEFYLKGRSFEDFFYEPRRKVSGFIDREAERILDNNPRIVGCSSTYQEHCASLALLRRIRQLAPQVITMMGGSNCEDLPGVVTHRRFDWVDYVVSGEAELLLPGLCKKIFEKGRDIEMETLPAGVIGPAQRNHHTQVIKPVRSIIKDMDQSPIPDFDDYFEEIENSTIKDYIYPGLVFETSRGCWWGEKNQCSFCGFNGKALSYRSKSPQRVIRELEILAGKYGINNFLAADRILNMEYFTSLLPALKDSQKKYTIMFETKSALSREQVALLAGAGVKFIQPGIESLHNGILKKLNKGIKTWQNIELLKWTREFGINTLWLMLYDLPDADGQDDWYEEMARVIPLITHLQPPIAINRIFYLRFSKYFNNPHRYKLKLEPFATYSYVYPLTVDDIEKFAGFFDVEKKPGKFGKEEWGKGIEILIEHISQWIKLWEPFRASMVNEPVSLIMEENQEGINILDTRPCSVEKHIKLTGLSAMVYKICEKSSRPGRIAAELSRKGYPGREWSDLAPIIEELQRKKILLKIEDRFLSLAVWRSDFKISWKFSGGEIYPDKLMKAFSQNRLEPDIYTPRSKSLEELFGS